RLRIWIPDVLPGKVRVPGGGHELEQAAGAAGAVDGQRVVVAFAVCYPQRPAQPRTVAEHGVDGGQPIPARAGRRREGPDGGPGCDARDSCWVWNGRRRPFSPLARLYDLS